jgi:exodeoxyribonuclease VII large subunit
VRASTPSVAGRLVVPDLAELLDRLGRARSGLERGARRSLDRERQRLERDHERLRRAPRLLVERRRATLEHSAGRLRALSPASTLERGYAIVRANEQILRSGAAVKPGERVEVELAEGGFGARVEETR